MCNRVIHGFALVLFATTQAPAQSTADHRRRVDSLAKLWTLAVKIAGTADSARLHRLPHDTVRAGPLVILADTEYLDVARRTADGLAPELQRAFGRSVARLTRYPIVVRVLARSDSGIPT